MVVLLHEGLYLRVVGDRVQEVDAEGSSAAPAAPLDVRTRPGVVGADLCLSS
jgi:hypothetical protein